MTPFAQTERKWFRSLISSDFLGILDDWKHTYYLLSPRQVSPSRISSNLNGTLASGLSFVERCVMYVAREFLRRTLIDCFESRCRVVRSARLRKESVLFRIKLTVRFYKVNLLHLSHVFDTYLVPWKFSVCLQLSIFVC